MSVPTSLWECVCVYTASSIPSLLSAWSLCMYACVVLLPVCLSACAPFNWRSSLADPASHTPRQLERWIIWAVSGPVSLWALLYITLRAWKKGKRICINSRRAPAACTADKAQAPHNTAARCYAAVPSSDWLLLSKRTEAANSLNVL